MPLVILAWVAPQFTAADASAERLFEVIDTLPAIADAPQIGAIAPTAYQRSHRI
jgi:ABC-type multidrug transport system fused ATPase/permease subunit